MPRRWHELNRSIYRQFFTPRRNFTEGETSFFVDVDFIKHVALIAVIEADRHEEIVGGERYVVGEPGEAELWLLWLWSNLRAKESARRCCADQCTLGAASTDEDHIFVNFTVFDMSVARPNFGFSLLDHQACWWREHGGRRRKLGR